MNPVDIITAAAQRYGVSPSYLIRTAQIESGMNPNAQNPNSSAGGLFQFVDGTARQYGLTNKFDPVAASDAAARLAADNRRALMAALGRDVDDGELYLAHQQGAGGATKLLSNPGARAADLVGLEAVRLNGGSPDMTAGEFAAKWTGKHSGQPVLSMGARSMSAPGGQTIPGGLGGSKPSDEPQEEDIKLPNVDELFQRAQREEASPVFSLRPRHAPASQQAASILSMLRRGRA